MSETITSLKTAVLPVTKLVVTGHDSVQREYSLVLDYNAIAKAQTEIGRDLTNIANWRGLDAKELSTVCWAALDRFHPDVSLAELRSWLAPAQKYELFAMLIEQCWPGILGRIEQAAAEEAGKAAGENEPNHQPATSAV